MIWVGLYFLIAFFIFLHDLKGYGKRPYLDDIIDCFFSGLFWGFTLILWVMAFAWSEPKYPGQK